MDVCGRCFKVFFICPRLETVAHDKSLEEDCRSVFYCLFFLNGDPHFEIGSSIFFKR